MVELVLFFFIGLVALIWYTANQGRERALFFARAECRKLAVSMYRFGALYELFRPSTIDHYSPYHGTVKTMDGIFRTLSQVFDIELNTYFSRFGTNILSRILDKQPRDRGEVDWDELKNDVEYVSRMIDEAITRYSLRNFRYFSYGHYYFFEELVKKISRTTLEKHIFVGRD